MIGDGAIHAWRIRRLPIVTVDVIVTDRRLPRSAFECSVYERPTGWHGDVWVSPEEPIETLDWRFCHGLDVFVHADSEEEGQRVLQTVLGADPREAHLVVPGKVVSMSPREVSEWAV